MGQSKVLYAVGKAVCKPVFKLLYRYKTITVSYTHLTLPTNSLV